MIWIQQHNKKWWCPSPCCSHTATYNNDMCNNTTIIITIFLQQHIRIWVVKLTPWIILVRENNTHVNNVCDNTLTMCVWQAIQRIRILIYHHWHYISHTHTPKSLLLLHTTIMSPRAVLMARWYTPLKRTNKK